MHPPESSTAYGYDAHLVVCAEVDPTSTGKRKWVCLYCRGEGDREHWEVVVAKERGPFVVKGTKISGGVSLPSPSGWGVSGWTLLELRDAVSRYGQVIQQNQTR